jgi:nucleotide-binding universal stress UspA family protein
VFEALEWSTPSIKLLDVLHVVQQQVHDQALAYLDVVATRLRSRALHVQTRVVTQADPGAAILDFAHPPTIDLIAIETRGHRQDFLLGSVARKVIHGMSVLVLVQSAMTPAENTVDAK